MGKSLFFVGITLGGKDHFTTGNIKTENDAGSAKLAIPLQGSKGTAKLYLVPTKSAGTWTYSKLTVTVESDHRQIDLLHDNGDRY